MSFAGQPIPLSLLGSTPTYGIFGGDVTAFANQTGELLFSGYAVLDNITFSGQAIPEPSVPALATCGVLLAGLAFLRQRKLRIGPQPELRSHPSRRELSTLATLLVLDFVILRHYHTIRERDSMKPMTTNEATRYESFPASRAVSRSRPDAGWSGDSPDLDGPA